MCVEQMNIEVLVDMALATPKSGVLNLSILHSLLHIIIRKLNLHKCKVEFTDRLHENMKNTKQHLKCMRINEYHAGNLVETELDNNAEDKIIKIKRIYEIPTSQEKLHIASEVLADIINSFGVCNERLQISKEIVSGIIESTATKASCNRYLKTILTDIIENTTKSCVEKKDFVTFNVLNDIIQQVCESSDPFLRSSQIEEIINKKLLENCDATLEFKESLKYFEEDLQKKMENFLRTLVENKAIDEVSQEKISTVNLFKDAETQAGLSEDSEHERLQQNITILERQLLYTNSSRGIDLHESENNPKRCCGGDYTCTTPSNRIFRKGNFKEQYIDFIAQQMKQAPVNNNTKMNCKISNCTCSNLKGASKFMKISGKSII